MLAAPGAGWSEGISLAPMTSWRIGGPCRAFVEPQTPAELTEARRGAQRRGWPVFILGGGTNILVADQGFPGLVIRYGDRSRLADERGDEAIVRVGARSPVAALARATARSGWRGLEWAEGIPGTVGGAVVGNAGAYGGEISRVLESVLVTQADGAVERWPVERMEYAYRRSCLKGRATTGPIVTAASFRLQRDDPARLAAEVLRIGAERKAKTPIGASCGSVFKNPEGSSAGKMIDLAGCKGMRHGGAAVSELHANYILNEGGASAGDVLILIEAVRDRVRAAFGVSLELEIQLVGFGLAGEIPTS